ncbi:MAG TPA: protein-methionine-sulfoxide reductase catalytic subunit MsrP [Alphaproteobacteria bacterium]
MLIRVPRGWELPESAVSPESALASRRQVLGGLAAGIGVGLGLGALAPAWAAEGPAADLYPFPRNEAFDAGRKLTDERLVQTYNNFYEFGSHKKVWKAAQKLRTDPWTVAVDGMVEAPFEIGVEDLLRRMPVEERIYRHRCVEAWAMTVPWGGFPLAALVALARPLASASYVRFECFQDRDLAPGQRQAWFPWPYTEGLTIPEATSELAFIATGLFGKPLEKQNGAPIRLVLPWKYGFKSIKSIVRVTFTDQRPATFWNTINDKLYGFWANVNPDVPFPDWSQATEKLLGEGREVPTRIFNGYGEQVAHLYDDVKGENVFF